MSQNTQKARACLSPLHCAFAKACIKPPRQAAYPPHPPPAPHALQPASTRNVGHPIRNHPGDRPLLGYHKSVHHSHSSRIFSPLTPHPPRLRQRATPLTTPRPQLLQRQNVPRRPPRSLPPAEPVRSPSFRRGLPRWLPRAGRCHLYQVR